MARRKYALVWWTVDDLSDEVAQNEIEMTDKEAHEFLSSIEKRLEEAMIATGWTVIQDALSELERSRESQATPVP
jgi:hypothetical protein